MDPVDLMLVSFKSHLRVETIPAEAVCLISERGTTALSGPSIEKLAPLLDGTRTVGRVKQELSEDLPEAEVEQLLARLREADLLALCQTEAADHRLDEEARAYWSLAGVDADRAASALAMSAVEIICTGSVAPETVAAACRESGLTVREPGTGPAALCLVLCDDYLDPALSRITPSTSPTGAPGCWPSRTGRWRG